MNICIYVAQHLLVVVCVFLMWHVVNRDLGWHEQPGLAHEIWQFKIAGI